MVQTLKELRIFDRPHIHHMTERSTNIKHPPANCKKYFFGGQNPAFGY